MHLSPVCTIYNILSLQNRLCYQAIKLGLQWINVPLLNQLMPQNSDIDNEKWSAILSINSYGTGLKSVISAFLQLLVFFGMYFHNALLQIAACTFFES